MKVKPYLKKVMSYIVFTTMVSLILAIVVILLDLHLNTVYDMDNGITVMTNEELKDQYTTLGRMLVSLIMLIIAVVIITSKRKK